ncbi:hypothetical protein [Pseudomonas rhodesiae]|uniref:hypothetical protein n=1 Tax=Pseudomonas rhodesiae TaxID=76760 RepID=UPI002B1DFFAB|nr:hypothetical protein [Pseudomonas rhodesiae]
MALTLNFNVSADVRVVIQESDLTAFRVSRDMARVAVKHGKELNDQKMNKLELETVRRMLSDDSDEEVIKFLMRSGAREHVQESLRELARDNCTDKKSARVSPVKVVFKDRPEVS